MKKPMVLMIQPDENGEFWQGFENEVRIVGMADDHQTAQDIIEEFTEENKHTHEIETCVLVVFDLATASISRPVIETERTVSWKYKKVEDIFAEPEEED